MMFDLEIQSTDQPGNKLIARSEISGGLDLVNSPLVWHIAAIGSGEMRMFYSVSKLKNNAYDKPGDQSTNKKAYKP
jgi:hypothetical protein